MAHSSRVQGLRSNGKDLETAVYTYRKSDGAQRVDLVAVYDVGAPVLPAGFVEYQAASKLPTLGIFRQVPSSTLAPTPRRGRDGMTCLDRNPVPRARADRAPLRRAARCRRSGKAPWHLANTDSLTASLLHKLRTSLRENLSVRPCDARSYQK